MDCAERRTMTSTRKRVGHAASRQIQARFQNSKRICPRARGVCALGCRALALLVAAAGAFGCGSSASDAAGSATGGASQGGGASGGTAGVGHGGSAGAGGTHNQGTGGIGEMCLICGGFGFGGGLDHGGSAGAGSAGSGGSGGIAPSPCFGGNGALVSAAKACETDADCEALPTANCCGPSVIVGIAISARAYEACYPYPTGCPAGLGCASFASTEDGMQPGVAPASFKLSCAAVDGGPKTCRTVSKDSSEGTLWSCRCATGASCCQPAGTL